MDFPNQVSFSSSKKQNKTTSGAFDMRDALNPRRLTIVMWDQAFLLRHIPGGSFEDFDKVLDETQELGYNTLRLDPMPQWLDLSQPDKILHWADPKQPYMPWCWNTEVEGPIGLWLIEFMEKMLKRDLFYTLSAWWFHDERNGPPLIGKPLTHVQAAELWITMLREWKNRFGFDKLVYVDLSNEVPYFLPDYSKTFAQETGGGWGEHPAFTQKQIEFLARDLNSAMFAVQKEFPELRFTCSIHGDVRWLDVPVEFDCLDVHFYSDADPRWGQRTRFGEVTNKLFVDTEWHKDFSDRCEKTSRAIAPMLRARQRDKLSQFADWAQRRGMPLTTSESWSSWYYFDSPDLDWGWLLDWAEWSVEDALEFGMWGWTPHNYCQPQFANWKDVRWHRRLNDKFLRG